MYTSILQFEAPILSACTMPSSTKDCRTSLTVCDTFVIRSGVSILCEKEDSHRFLSVWVQAFQVP